MTETKDKSRKHWLVLQSFAPLLVLLLIKYYDHGLWHLFTRFFEDLFLKKDLSVFSKAWAHPECLHMILICVLIVMILIEILILFSFSNYQKVGFYDGGEKIIIKEDKTETSVTFFTAYIMSLLLDDLTTSRGLLLFLMIFLIMFILLEKTNLYYRSPLLVVMGYRLVKFEFAGTTEETMCGKTYIGITHGKIDYSKIIKRKKITDDVYLIYNKN